MKRSVRFIALILAIILIPVAYALPAASPLETDGNDITVLEADFEAPEIGEWLSYALALDGDESRTGSLRFHFADAAADLGYNDYSAMQPQEKAVAIYAMFGSNFDYEGAMLFADDEISDGLIPICVVPSGNYALFTFDGIWSFDSTFTLESPDEEAVGLLLTFDGLDGKPALAAKETEDGWKIVGINSELLDEIIRITFVM